VFSCLARLSRRFLEAPGMGNGITSRMRQLMEPAVVLATLVVTDHAGGTPCLDLRSRVADLQ
jgi:hypothetical protein